MAIKIEYAVQESITNIKRNVFITFAAVLVIATSLALGGGSLLMKSAIQRTADTWTGKVSVAIFLCEPGPGAPCLGTAQKDQLESELKTMDEVRSYHFESKQEAFENYKRLFADDEAMLRLVQPEALPESFRVQLKDSRKFEVVRERFRGRPGMYVRDEREFVKKLFSFSDTLQFLTLVVSGVVLIAALLLIATTIRMAIYARRKEIGIMKLVGATNWFIRIPFMVEGMVQGAIGAAVALVLLVLAKPLIFSHLVRPGLAFTISYTDIFQYGLYLLGMGLVLGAAGSLLGLRRILDV
jgi:cell division transport system permease protein